MKGVFKCAKEDDEKRSGSVERSSLGMPPCTPKKYSRRLKHLSLGIPSCIPFSINDHQSVLLHTIFFITSCVMCYTWSISLFSFQFIYFCLLFITSWNRPTLFGR